MAGYGAPTTTEPETSPPSGKVVNVKNQWRVHEDGVLAHQLQEREFEHKYDWNKKDRKTARKDAPMARVVQSEEEERLQRERMLQLEELKLQAQADAAVARQAHEEEVSKSRQSRLSSVEFDAAMADKYSSEEDHGRRMLELKDQELALQLQEKERRKYEIRKQQKHLAKQRKDIEYLQQVETDRILGDQPLEEGIGNMNLTDGQTTKVLRPDGKLEDLGDFSDFYIQPSGQMDRSEQRELQELQDEELARLLQDQEHKRGATVDRDRLKQIEDRDADLARVIMEQEKLKVLKRKEAKQRQQQQRQMSEPGPPTQPPVGISHPRGSSMTAHSPVHDDQNHTNERMRSEHERSRYSREDNDGSSGGIRALGRQLPPGGMNGYTQERTPVDRDPHYESHYGQRPLPATPGNESHAGRTPHQNGRHPTTDASLSRLSQTPSNEVPRSNRPVRSNSPREDEGLGSSVNSGNVIASIDPTFNRDRDGAEPVPQLQTPSPPPLEASPPQTINRQAPSEYENLPSPKSQRSSVTSGGEDSSYCDLDDVQNFTPVQGQKRSTQKKESRKSSKKDKNCKQQ